MDGVELTAENTLIGELNFPAPTTGIDTTDATAAAAEILEGRTAYMQQKRVVGTMPNLGELEIEPTTEEIVIGPGFIEESKILPVTNTIDENIDAKNIKRGVTILGVDGTLDVDLDTSDATAEGIDIREGKTAYINGEKVSGRLAFIKKDIRPIVLLSDEAIMDIGKVELEATFDSRDFCFEKGAKIRIRISNEDLATAIGLTKNKLKSGMTVLGIMGE